MTNPPSLTAFIYGLFDPRNPLDIRYVGKTNNLARRLMVHISYARNPKSIRNLRLLGWMRELLASGIKPKISVLEECPMSQWRDRERFWISRFRVQGGHLLNIDDGGNGAGFINEETRRRMSEVRLGKKHSAERRRNIGLGQIGNRRGEATRKILSDLARARGTAYLQTPEVRAKAAASLRGRTFSVDHRRAISEAAKRRWLPGGDRWMKSSPMLGKKHTDEARAKMRAAHARRRYE
jgi:hypothetical protein